MNNPSSSDGPFSEQPSGQTPADGGVKDPSAQPPLADASSIADPPAAAAAVPLEAVPVCRRVNPVAVITSAEAMALALTEPQRRAIIRLTSGDTRVEAATAAGVTRNTLYRWLNHDPAFIAAYNAWQKDLITTAQGQLLAASQEAIGVVLGAIRWGDRRLAWKLLESQGLTKTAKPGTTDVRQLQRKEELDRKREEIAERKEINTVLEQDMSTMDPCSGPLG